MKQDKKSNMLVSLFSGDIGVEILSWLFQPKFLCAMKELVEKRLVCKIFLCCVDRTFSQPRFIEMLKQVKWIPGPYISFDSHYERNYMPLRMEMLQQNSNNDSCDKFKIECHNPLFFVSKYLLSNRDMHVYSACNGKLTKLLFLKVYETILKIVRLIDNVFVLSDKTIELYLLCVNQVKKILDVTEWNMKEKEDYLEFSSFCIGDCFVIQQHQLENKLTCYFIPKKIVLNSKETIDFKKSAIYTIQTKEREIEFGENDCYFIAEEDNRRTFKIVFFSNGVIREEHQDVNPTLSSLLLARSSWIYIRQVLGRYFTRILFEGQDYFWDSFTGNESDISWLKEHYSVIGDFLIWETSGGDIYCYEKDLNEKDCIKKECYFKPHKFSQFEGEYSFVMFCIILRKLYEHEPFLFSIASRKDVLPYFFGKENPPLWIENLISFARSENRTSHGIARWNDDKKCIELDGFVNDDKSTK